MVSWSNLFIVFFWLMGFYFLWRIPTLLSNTEESPSSINLSVIIPARNEAPNISILLESLKWQTSQPAEIIVVNDHSNDATAEVAAKTGCRIIHSAPLPDGWFGKPWACWQGAMKSQGRLLLFLDADIHLAPDAIQRLYVTYMNKRGLVSVQPFHSMRRAYERLAAFFNIIAMAGMNSFTPLKPMVKPVGAFGPCNICSRSDYFKVDGHRVVRQNVVESIGFGWAFLNSNLPLSCYGGIGVVSFRMYPHGIRLMVEGFAKSFGSGAMSTTLISRVIIFCWVFACVHLTIHLIQSAVHMYLPSLLFYCLFDVLFVIQIHWMLKRIGNFKFISALFFQIPLFFFITVFILSVFNTFFLKRIRWKGRKLSLGSD